MVDRGKKSDRHRDMPMGIVHIRGRWLGYGWKHGWFLGWPSWFHHAIVGSWNKLICFFFGHDTILVGMDIPIREQVCPQCSKLLAIGRTDAD